MIISISFHWNTNSLNIDNPLYTYIPFSSVRKATKHLKRDSQSQTTTRETTMCFSDHKNNKNKDYDGYYYNPPPRPNQWGQNPHQYQYRYQYQPQYVYSYQKKSKPKRRRGGFVGGFVASDGGGGGGCDGGGGGGCWGMFGNLPLMPPYVRWHAIISYCIVWRDMVDSLELSNDVYVLRIEGEWGNDFNIFWPPFFLPFLFFLLLYSEARKIQNFIINDVHVRSIELSLFFWK